MGQTLSSPATDKNTEFGGDDCFHFAVSEMQGWRITMEDAHAAVLDLDETKKAAFFGVYDGHGGNIVAKYAGQNVHKFLVSTPEYQQGSYSEALKRAFLGIDEELVADPAYLRSTTGCTAVAALIADERIYLANAGDSRSVISVNGLAKALSTDHKPSVNVERERILSAGGWVEYGRVNGNLALSRALGDFQFKKNYSLGPQKQIITAEPDVQEHALSDDDEFLVLACDGIWDCLSSQQVVDFIRLKVSQGSKLVDICRTICDHCLAPDTSSTTGIGCDNMTILIVAILGKRTEEQWYDWVTDRVNKREGYLTPATIPEIYAEGPRKAFYQSMRQSRVQEREVGFGFEADPEVELPDGVQLHLALQQKVFLGHDLSSSSEEALRPSINGEGTPTQWPGSSPSRDGMNTGDYSLET